MIESPVIGETVIVMKGGGSGGTVLGFWADEDMGIEWVVVRVHDWSDADRAWMPSKKLVPLMVERESLTRPLIR